MFVKIPKFGSFLIMAKKFFFLFFLCFPLFIKAQYTEIINSNLPGFSESPYSVGKGVYQLESNLFFRKASAIPTFSNPQALGLNLHFRTCFFFDKLEFNLNTSLQQDKIAFKNVFESSHNQFGLGKFTLAAKYLVFEPTYTDKGKEIRSWNKRHSFDTKRWIPNVAVYAGANFGSFLNDYHERGGITPKAGVLLQNNFSNQFNVITNIYYDYIGSDFPEISYIITGTYNFNDTWVGFAEHQALFNKQEKQSNFGGGLAYLFSNDLQLNASLRATFQENGIGFYTGIGASYRIDRHVDKFIELDEYGNKIEDINKETYNKGFFGRMFDKIKGLFKKGLSIFKKKKKDEDGTGSESGEEEISTERKREKSVLDDIIKGDKKLKKQKRKATKKEEKAQKREKRRLEKEKQRAEKEKQREEKRAEKELEKEEKRQQKELEKLEKEIKELEEEKKKEEEKEEEKSKKED